LFLILSHNNKKSFLRVAVKKLTATIQIFLGLGCQGVLARLPAGRLACIPQLAALLPACRQTGLTEK